MFPTAPEGSLADAFRRQCFHPGGLEIAKLLAYLGADYIVVHKKFYLEKDLEEIDKNLGLKLIRDFPTAKVYKIIIKPDELVTVFWQNFASWEKWDDGNYWRWMGNDATIWIGNGLLINNKSQISTAKLVNISFKILAFAKMRELEIYVNNILIKKLDVISPLDPSLAQRVELNGIYFSRGENIIRFYTPQGETRIGDVMGNSDSRRVSFAITNFRLQSIETSSVQ